MLRSKCVADRKIMSSSVEKLLCGFFGVALLAIAPQKTAAQLNWPEPQITDFEGFSERRSDLKGEFNQQVNVSWSNARFEFSVRTFDGKRYVTRYQLLENGDIFRILGNFKHSSTKIGTVNAVNLSYGVFLNQFQATLTQYDVEDCELVSYSKTADGSFLHNYGKVTRKVLGRCRH